MRKLIYYSVSLVLMVFCMSNIQAQDPIPEKKAGESGVTETHGKQSEPSKTTGTLKSGKHEMYKGGTREYKVTRDFRAKEDRRGGPLVERTFTYESDQAKQRSELRLFKKFEGETTSTTKTFDVDGSSMHLSLIGKVESGKINVKFSLPDGKEYKELDVDAASNVSWKAKLDSTDNVKFVGKWTIQIKVDKAVGEYNLMIGTR